MCWEHVIGTTARYQYIDTPTKIADQRHASLAKQNAGVPGGFHFFGGGEFFWGGGEFFWEGESLRTFWGVGSPRGMRLSVNVVRKFGGVTNFLLGGGVVISQSKPTTASDLLSL